MEFEKARLYTKAVKEDSLKQSLILLANVIESKKRITQKQQQTSFPNKQEKFIYLLIEGYQELYDEDASSLKAYKSFTEALQTAEELNKNHLVKAALMGMLDLLRREIFIGSKQFVPYLGHFKQLKSDDIDEVILSFYEVVFYSKADENLKISDKYKIAKENLDYLFQRLDKDNLYFPYYHHEKGIEFKFSKRYDSAAYHFQKVYNLTKGKKVYFDLYNTNLWQLADLMQRQGKLNDAKKFLLESREASKNKRDLFYDDRLSSTIFKKEGVFDSAYYYLRKSIDLEYTLGYKNNSLESSILAIQNETDKLKLDTLRLQNRANKLELETLKLDSKRRWNRNWLIAASLALLLGTGIAILLQKNTTKKRLLAEQEAILKQQRVENLLKEQELVSIDAMIAGQEKERQKVAGELHDDLGSLMATIKLHFDNAKVSQTDPALQNAQKLLEEAYQKIRGMAHSKNSGVMSDQGLLPAIKKMAQTITETDALEVTIEDFGLGERMENSLELSIFRMIQELVANAIKHAEASQVTIQLTQHDDSLNIIVEDDGNGFDRSKLNKKQSGIGLASIEKRIEHLEGNFTIDSILGQGTTILIDIPV
ncbi:MAG: sensor histidine kinase [Croceivirga sp.]